MFLERAVGTEIRKQRTWAAMVVPCYACLGMTGRKGGLSTLGAKFLNCIQVVLLVGLIRQKIDSNRQRYVGSIMHRSCLVTPDVSREEEYL